MMGLPTPKAPLHFSRTLLSPPPPPPSFRAPPPSSNGSVHLASRIRAWNRKVATFCSISASSYPASAAYGGWDDPSLEDDAQISGNLEAFRNLLAAMGIADGKYAILFCLGFLSALAVSRVRVWTLAALPFSGLVFVCGVLVGVARGGVAGDLLARIRRNRGSVELSREEMKDFGGLLDDFGVKLSELKSSLQRFVNLNRVGSGEMRAYFDVLDSATLATIPLKKLVEDSTGNELRSGPMGEDRELETKSNAKSSKKRREVSMVGADPLQFLADIFQDVLIGRDAHKTKYTGTIKEAVDRLNSMEPSFQAAAGAVDESDLANKEGQMPVPTNIQEDVKVNPSPTESFEGRPLVSEMLSGSMKRNSAETMKTGRFVTNARSPVSGSDSTESGNRSFHSRGDSCDHDMLSDKDNFHVLNGDIRFMSMQGSYQKVVLEHKSHKTEIGRQQRHMDDHSEGGFNSRVQEDEMISFSAEAETSLKSRKIAEIYDKAYFPTNDRINGKVKNERATQTTGFRDRATKLETQTILDNQHSEHDIEASKKSSPSEAATAKTSTEEEFDHVVKHGVDLLREAGECLKGQNDEKAAEILLYRSSRLLSTAVSMKPGNLLALGQLGNTCLLHGELKLKMSRDLRALLSTTDAAMIRKRRRSQSREQSNRLNKEKVTSVLFDVCEECEELLIEAGRNYKMLLSYDKNDARALYNWGLALSFRAQLIADVGPDAAFDADKVYLAAIEKFDAMLSRSSDYAPDALFRWGIALLQRSHLRPRNSSEKMKLLQQAKALFEDVLHVDSDNPHVREALHSCVSELNFGRRLE